MKGGLGAIASKNCDCSHDETMFRHVRQLEWVSAETLSGWGWGRRSRFRDHKTLPFPTTTARSNRFPLPWGPGFDREGK